MLIENYQQLAKAGKFRTIEISTDENLGQLYLSTIHCDEVGFEGSIIYSSPIGLSIQELEELQTLFSFIRL
jgi:hypothetical protein